MVTLAVKMGCSSQIMYLALFYFGNCQYKQSLICLQKAQEEYLDPMPCIMDTTMKIYTYVQRLECQLVTKWGNYS